MLYVHNIHITVFCKPEDDESKIKEGLFKIIPFDLNDEKVKKEIDFKIESASIVDERKMKIFTIILKKQKHTNEFIKSLFSKLGKNNFEVMKTQIDSRVDDNASFFIRIDKDELIYNDKYILTDSGACFHIRMSVAAYPSNKEKALVVVKQIFENLA